MVKQKLHPEDRAKLYRFIDYARLKRSQKEDVKLEIDARYLAEFVGINPDMSNRRLANAFANKIEAKAIIA